MNYCKHCEGHEAVSADSLCRECAVYAAITEHGSTAVSRLPIRDCYRRLCNVGLIEDGSESSSESSSDDEPKPKRLKQSKDSQLVPMWLIYENARINSDFWIHNECENPSYDEWRRCHCADTGDCWFEGNLDRLGEIEFYIVEDGVYETTFCKVCYANNHDAVEDALDDAARDCDDFYEQEFPLSVIVIGKKEHLCTCPDSIADYQLSCTRCKCDRVPFYSCRCGSRNISLEGINLFCHRCEDYKPQFE
jgi:hypothetical protein